jgi:flagellar basal-body rod protein FlgF
VDPGATRQKTPAAKAAKTAALTFDFFDLKDFFGVARPLQRGLAKGHAQMDTALYVGLSRQMTLQRALDIAANNIANADTAGFKVEQLLLEADPLTPPAFGAAPVNYVIDNGVARDFGQGEMETTGNAFDLSVEGQGFFTVQTAQGDRYTRDGRFSVDAQNRLVNRNGDPVLSSGGAPITLDPTQPAPKVAQDGTISQGGASLGRVGVVRFPDQSVLSKAGDDGFTAPDGASVAANDAIIRQGMVERSNVQPVLEITHLIEITRAYERVAKMMEANQSMTSTAIQRLGQVS